MSKTVTIPTGGGNPFVVILGGVKYVYKPGETVEVPDGVALEIEEWERWHKKYYGENVPPFASPIDDITAEVGQTIVVKSVDENGKPTEWEATKPGEKWELIKTLNFTEDTYSIDTIQTDDNGNPFELTAYQVVSVSGAPSASQMFRINPLNNGRNVSSANAYCEPTWGTGDRGLFAQVRIEASRIIWYIMGNGMNLNLRWAALALSNITQISWSNFGSNYIKAGSVVEIWGIRA